VRSGRKWNAKGRRGGWLSTWPVSTGQGMVTKLTFTVGRLFIKKCGRGRHLLVADCILLEKKKIQGGRLRIDVKDREKEG